MATPSGSDGAPKTEYFEASSSGSSSSSTSSLNSSSRSSSYSFSSGDSSSTMRSSSATLEPTRLTIQQLEDITDNFSEDRLLGKGSYGKVYKGRFGNGEEIAVKILHNNMKEIDNENFQHEFTNLMMLDHKNIVRLVAYCYETRHQHMDFNGRTVFPETTYKALCFDFMHMGSLQRHISDEMQAIDWQKCYKIIKGICEGLKYLHEGLNKPIYHLDLKPDNILLDKNMVPKVADFGLSKLFPNEQTRVTQTLGTWGYMPPEFVNKQVISKKFDIFSLGVVITKIISGPRGHTRSAEIPFQEFLDQVNEKWRNKLEATTSQTLEATYEQVRICTEIGLRCMDEDRHRRPSIVDIIHILDVTETMMEKGTTLRRLISNTNFDDNRSANFSASSVTGTRATLFCQETVDNAIMSLDSLEDYKILKAEESSWRFKEISDTLLNNIVTMYDRETERYDRKVRDRERQHMVEKLRKVFKEDSQELIRKMLKNASEQFEREYTKYIKSLEESDSELKYDDLLVDSCVEEFMNSCEELKVFDPEYLQKKSGELQKRLHLYTVHHVLRIKEIRGRKEVEHERQRSRETAEELLENTRQMLANQQKHTEMMFAEKQEEAEKTLAMHKKQVDNMFVEIQEAEKLVAVEKTQMAKMLAEQQETEKLLSAQKEQTEGMLAEKQAAEKLLAVQKEHMKKLFAVQKTQMENLLSKNQEAEELLAVQKEEMEKMLAEKKEVAKLFAVQKEQIEKMLGEKEENMLAMQKEQTERLAKEMADMRAFKSFGIPYGGAR